MTSAQLPPDEEISLAEVTQRLVAVSRTLWDARRLLLRWALAAGLCGAFVAFTSPTEYQASTRIIPYSTSPGGSSLASLANLAGVRVPSAGASEVVTVDLYPAVAQSFEYLVQVAETPIRFGFEGRSFTSVQYFQEVYRPNPALGMVKRYTIGLPFELIRVARQVVAGVAPADSVKPAAEDSTGFPRRYSQGYLDAVQTVRERIDVNFDKRAGIVTISAQMPDPYAAAALVQTASDMLMLRAIEFKSGKAAAELRYVRNRHEEARARFERAQRAMAESADRSRGTLTAVSRLESQRVQSEYEMAMVVYRQLSTELEQARLRESQDTPAFAVLDGPIVPNRRSSPRRGRMLMVSVILGLVGGSLHALSLWRLRS